MKLPDEIKVKRDAGASTLAEFNSQVCFKSGFNAGFAAFRNSEMMKELVGALREYHGIAGINCKNSTTQWSAADEALDKYKKWVGDV